ncbi:hypothetical protein ACFVH6_09150 [Spirillospora sp. NPDC127200]
MILVLLALQKVKAEQQMRVLAQRWTDLMEAPNATPGLLDALRQVAGQRSEEHAAGDPLVLMGMTSDEIDRLMDVLRDFGSGRPGIERLPAAGSFTLFLESDPTFRFGCEPHGRPARPWSWDDLD